MLTCCASLAAAAASPVSTDATRAPSLTGRSCLGRVGVTRANVKVAATEILLIEHMLVWLYGTPNNIAKILLALLQSSTFGTPWCIIPVSLSLHFGL